MLIFLDKNNISNADLEWINAKKEKEYPDRIDLVKIKGKLSTSDILSIITKLSKLREDMPLLLFVIYDKTKGIVKEDKIASLLLNYLNDQAKEKKFFSQGLFAFIEDTEELSGLNNYLKNENFYYIGKGLRIFMLEFLLRLTKTFVDKLSDEIDYELTAENILYALAWNKYAMYFNKDQRRFLEDLKSGAKGYSNIVRLYYKYIKMPNKVRALYFLIRGLTIEDMVKVFGRLSDLLEEDELDDVIDMLTPYKKEDISFVRDKMGKIAYLSQYLKYMSFEKAKEQIEKVIDHPKGLEVLNLKLSLMVVLKKKNIPTPLEDCLAQIDNFLNQCGVAY